MESVPWMSLAHPTEDRSVWVVEDADAAVVFEASAGCSRAVLWTLGPVPPHGAVARRVPWSVLDAVLLQAVHADFVDGLYPSKQAWRVAVRFARVRLSWVPVQAPSGFETTSQVPRLTLVHGPPDGLSAATLPPCRAPDWRVPPMRLWSEARRGHADWLAGRG